MAYHKGRRRYDAGAPEQFVDGCVPVTVMLRAGNGRPFSVPAQVTGALLSDDAERLALKKQARLANAAAIRRAQHEMKIAHDLAYARSLPRRKVA